ncbi:Coiled-coil and C2 domain-containing protein 1B [Borealophlyctis nickersoniae]|nr:Coiled-coil and C2 domain-containing protein 1B [Borealophlyctis nickersoniae]
MWGFGSGSSTAKKKPTQAAGAAGAPGGGKKRQNDMFDFSFDPDAAFSDTDLNDPELLAELHGLTRSMGLPAASDPTPAAVPARSRPAPKIAPAATAPLTSKQPTPAASAAVAAATSSDGMVDVDALVAGIEFGDDTEGDVDVELTDADLNDPELLAALKAVGGSVSDEEDGAGDDNLHTSDMHLDDHIDGSYVPESATPAAHSQRSQFSQSQSESQSQARQQHQHQPQKEQIPPSQPADETLPLEFKLKASDPSLLDKYIKLERITAVNKKRAGDKAGALESLRGVKALEARYKEVMEAVDRGQMPPERVPPVAGERYGEKPVVAPDLGGSAQSLTEDASTDGIIGTEATAAAGGPSRKTQMTLDILKQRQTEYKQAALQAKRDNDLGRAREMLGVSKKMQEAIDVVAAGGDLPAGYTLPSSPADAPAVVSSSSTSPTGSPARKQASKTNRSGTPLGIATIESVDLSPTTNRTPTSPVSTTSPTTTTPASDIFTHLETTLNNQINLCTTIAAHYFKSSRKDVALTFHRTKKSLQTDLSTLQSLRSTPSAQPPRFSYTTMEYEIEQANPDLAVDEMEVGIVRAWGLGNRDVAGGDVESFVGWDVGWPTDDAGVTGADGKGDTVVVKRTGDPEYNHVKKVRIERTRTFQRYLERKKATFEVFHYRGFFGLGKRISLGKCSVKLDALLTKCEVHEIVELMDATNPRRSTGGKLEIRIRVRTPILKPDIAKKQEKWLVVHFGGDSAGSVVLQSAGATGSVGVGVGGAKGQPGLAVPQQTQPQRQKTPSPTAQVAGGATPAALRGGAAASAEVAGHGQASPAPAKQPAAVNAKPATAASTAQSPAAGGIDLDDLEMRFNKYRISTPLTIKYSPDDIWSNAVLENEVAQIVADISAAQRAKKPTEDLVDRKTAYEFRMNFLVMLVQMEKLTMPEYVKKLRTQSIPQTKQMALAFKNGGRMDLARRALARSKWMQAEVEEVEAELKAGEA